jgi:hypothetical protein
MADPTPANMKAMEEALKKVQRQLENVEKATKKTTQNINKNFQNAAGGTEYFGKRLEYAEETIDDIAKNMKKIHLEKGLPVGKVIIVNKQMAVLQKRIEHIKNLKGPFNAASLDKQKKRIATITKEAVSLNKNVSGGVKVSTQRFADMAEGAGSFKDLFHSLKGSPKDMLKTAEGAGEVADKLKSMGGMAKGLGSALGGVSKIFGGPAGIAMAAGKALFDITVQADTFVKNANKGFASIRGPDIMTSDVEGQFKEFNDQIYNASANIRDGLNADAIRGFMEALSQSGYNITRLQGGLTTYRTAVDVAAKASKSLGVDIVQVGAYMGTLLNDFREDLAEVDKSFVQVAFDAKKSGMSTNNFWNTVQNATASLTLYGVKIDSAGKLLKTFSQNQIGGVKDAEAAAQDMLSVFKSTDRAQSALIMQMSKSGGFDLAGAFQKKAGEQGTKATKIKEEIKLVEAKPRTEENLSALDKLHTDLVNAEKDQANYTKATILAQKGDYVGLGTYFGDLANNVSDIVPALLKGMIPGLTNIGKIDEHNLAVLEKTSQLTGLSVPALRTIVKNAQFVNKELSDLSDYMGDFGGKLIDATDETKKGIGDAITEMDSGNEKGFEDLNNALLQAGMDPVQAKEMANLAKSNEVIRAILKKTLVQDKVVAKKELVNLQKTLKSDDVSNKAAFNSIDDQKASAAEMSKKSDDTFKKITSLTLSSQETMDIMGDEAKYRLYSTTLFKGMNKGIGFIAKFLTKAFGSKVKGVDEYISPEEEEKMQQDASDKITNEIKNVKPDDVTKAVDDLNKKFPKDAKLSPSLMQAIVGHESGGNAMAVPKDKTGNVLSTARGPMQVIKDTAQRVVKESGDVLGVKGGKSGTLPTYGSDYKMTAPGTVDLTDTKTGLAVGGRVLQKELTKYGGDPKKAIAAYFQGDTVVDNAIKADSKDWMSHLVNDKGENVSSQVAAYINDVNKRIMDSAIGSTPTATPTKATMGMPERVTSPGIVQLHSGESIFPSAGNSRMRTTPLLNGGAMNSALGGAVGGGGKTININVSATEKDLAQRIANEVRGVLYKEQLTGMA